MATKISTHKTTLLGRPVERKTITLGGGATEVRVHFMDTDDYLSRTIKGNFVKGTGVVLVADHAIEASAF